MRTRQLFGMAFSLFFASFGVSAMEPTFNLRHRIPSALLHGKDKVIRKAIEKHNLDQDLQIPTDSPDVVRLGQALFFDRELSGPRDTSCATCHHPGLGSSDDRILPIGVHGEGMGKERAKTLEIPFIPRNSPEIFHRGSALMTAFFWDGRMQLNEDGSITSPAGAKLPLLFQQNKDLLAIQALFPVTSRHEMRGLKNDNDVFGQPNEIGAIKDGDLTKIWAALTKRLMKIEGYRDMFQQAFPELAFEDIGFEHAALAMAAFERSAFSPMDSPWDLYLNGKLSALTQKAKAGAKLFYGKANCVACHSGALFTDNKFHNLGVPQLGPGKSSDGLDKGRHFATKDLNDAFLFRTPPLRNVDLTGPYMHNGYYNNLEDVILHHLYPKSSLQAFESQVLPEDFTREITQTQELGLTMIKTLDEELENIAELSSKDIQKLIAFLESLSSKTAQEDWQILIPDSVPSGLPIDRL